MKKFSPLAALAVIMLLPGCACDEMCQKNQDNCTRAERIEKKHHNQKELTHAPVEKTKKEKPAKKAKVEKEKKVAEKKPKAAKVAKPKVEKVVKPKVEKKAASKKSSPKKAAKVAQPIETIQSSEDHARQEAEANMLMDMVVEDIDEQAYAQSNVGGLSYYQEEDLDFLLV